MREAFPRVAKTVCQKGTSKRILQELFVWTSPSCLLTILTPWIKSWLHTGQRRWSVSSRTLLKLSWVSHRRYQIQVSLPDGFFYCCFVPRLCYSLIPDLLSGFLKSMFIQLLTQQGITNRWLRHSHVFRQLYFWEYPNRCKKSIFFSRSQYYLSFWPWYSSHRHIYSQDLE